MRIDTTFFKTGNFKPTVLERKEERFVVFNDVKNILSKKFFAAVCNFECLFY
jgi:hypothetical protein